MSRIGHELLRGGVAEWFPLLPRARPPCRELPRRIDEIRELARSASKGANETRISTAAVAHNKAALILSDCGLTDLAQQICWRQFGIFHAATPLTTKTAKLALQPIVNLGRLLTRSGQNARAYKIYQNAYDAVRTQAATTIDGKSIDFSHLVDQVEQRQEIRRFLWSVLLADGTRTLTRAGQWDEALRHIEQHKGIGKRMLDGRQVAILARCTGSNSNGAIDMLDDSSTPEPWEKAVAACLRTLCLDLSDRSTGPSVAAMVSHYLQLDPMPGHPVFGTRLGLCVLDLAGGSDGAGGPEVAAKIAKDAVASTDAYVARDVLTHVSSQLSMTEADRHALAKIIGSSGLHRATMPANLLDGLMASVRTSETQLVQLLGAHRTDLMSEDRWCNRPGELGSDRSAAGLVIGRLNRDHFGADLAGR